MGATLRQNISEFDQASNTEQLFNWITRVRTKKIKYLCNRRRNIRVEAVLGHALTSAEHELREKQVARIHRWQEMKKQLQLKKNNDGSENRDCNADDLVHTWTGNLYPELVSLDTFMSNLSGVKTPLHR